MNIIFENKQDYLKFATEWKSLYRSNSDEIIQLKHSIKNFQRKHISDISTEQRQREILRLAQHDLLIERFEAKSNAKACYKTTFERTIA